ncbi:MAG: MATE family efflux transporter [Clostridiales bacterium]|nr:MATE family efflux transporter [Clostridiales bacterium]
MRNRLGSKSFYKMVLSVAVPMMIQNGLSNLVSLVDNFMIGRVGTNALSGVAIANQLVFVYYLLIFGATAGVGIFTAQYYGKGDVEGVRDTFRFKLIANTALALVSVVVFIMLAPRLISLFLQGEGAPEDAAQTLKIGVDYIKIILLSLVPIGLSMAYSGTLRDTGHTKVPMAASMVAILVNLIGDAVLIYGLFGLPAMGANGAAAATVIARVVELMVLVIYTGTHASVHGFIVGAFRGFRLPLSLCWKFILKSIPLMANETLWSLGMTVLNQCYSYRSLSAVAAVNIESTLWNLMSVSFVAMGESVGIIVGQILGTGDIAKAKDHAIKIRDFTVFCGVIFGLLMAVLAPIFPNLPFYNVSDEVRSLATTLILLSGIVMPLMSYTHASYFIIRAGGNTLITFVFDCGYTWLIVVPVAYCLSRFTSVGVPLMMFTVQWLELIKCFTGWIMVRSGVWAKNLVR